MNALLFDVMGTLVHDPFHVDVPSFFGITLPELMDCKHPTAWAEFERGELSEEEFLEKFFSDGRAFDHQGLKDCMADGWRWIEGTREILEDLVSGGQQVHFFSNYPTWYRALDTKLHLSNLAPWTFVSCETGIRKPDAGAYKNVLEDLQVAAETCLLIDDRPENCAAAQQIGMDAVVFQDAETLRTQLVTRSLIPG